MKELVKLEDLNAIDLFEKKTARALVEEISTEMRSNVYDIKTKEGRKALETDAKLINKWSNGLDGLGKAHVAELKAKPKLIDVERKAMRDALEELRTDILKPLTDWLTEEKQRVDGINDRINAMRVSSCGVLNPRAETLEGAKAFLAEIMAITIDKTFQEFQQPASVQHDESILLLEGIIAKKEKEELEAQEAARLAAEAEAKARLEREEQIRAEAEAKAVKEAEEKAGAAELAAAKALQDEKDRAEQAVRDKIAAEERAKLQAEQAVEAEKVRAEAEANATLAAEKEREANKAHNKKINNEVLAAIVGANIIRTDPAKKLIKLIAQGKIPHVSIKY